MSLRSRLARLLAPGVARRVAGRGASRRALMLYTVRAFSGIPLPDTHQNIWQQRELARALGELGFEVDVVEFNERRRGLLRDDYDLVLDLHPVEHPLYEGRLRPGALRIVYATALNPSRAEILERDRLADLERRRGVRLLPRRRSTPYPPSQVESADAFLCFGDRRILTTYASVFRLPPAFRVFNNGFDDVTPTEPTRRDTKRFLFLGSGGQVSRGLDLLLEVFASEPDLELLVCGPFRREADFLRAYRRELFATPQVRPIGFVDVKGARFSELQATCGHLLYPTAIEGQSGAVAAALSYGLPCMVSGLCGYDDPEVLEFLDCSVETIRAEVRRLAETPPPVLAARSRAGVELVRRRYRPAHFASGIRAALRSVLASKGLIPAGVAPPEPAGLRWEDA
jgi:glycosyltransferase involved in cell wall biosynthesis